MTSRLFSFYQRLILRHPVLALLTVLLLTAAMGFKALDLKIDASADSLVLEGDKALQFYRKVSKNYDTQDFLLITYRPHGQLFSDPVLEDIGRLRDKLERLPDVTSVVSILDVPLLESPKVSISDIASGELPTLANNGVDREQVKKEFQTSPLYRSLLMSPDGDITALLVNLKRDEHYYAMVTERADLRERQRKGELTDQQRQRLQQLERKVREYTAQAAERRTQMVAEVRSIMDEHRDMAELFLGGVPMIASDMIRFIKSDLSSFGIGVMVFIIIVMGVIFRHAVWVLLPLLTCAVSAITMLGLVNLLGWQMTVISSNFVALLLILTLQINIHLVVRYRELLGKDPDAGQWRLVRDTTKFMAKPCIFTALTTVVAFASLVVSDIRPVIDFGWMMTLGVLVALGMSFIVLPSGLLMMSKPPIMVTGTGSASFTIRFASLTDRFGKIILWVSTALVVLAAVGASRLQVENRFIDYFDPSTEIYQGMQVIDAELGGTIPLDIIIDVLPEDTELPGLDFEAADESSASQAAAAEDFEQAFGDSAGFNGDGFEDDFAASDDKALADDFEQEFGDSDDDFAFEQDSADAGPNAGAGQSGETESIQTSYWFTRAGLNRIEAVHDYVDSLDETGKTLSLATLYKLMKEILDGGVDDIQLALVQRSIGEDIKSILVDPYLHPNGEQTRINVRVMETSHSLRRDELLKKVRHDLVHKLGFKEEQVHLTGMLVLYNNMLQSLYRSQILTLGAVFFAITLVFWGLFRSLRIALITIAPTMLAAGVVLGGMGLVGIPLDIMTVTIAAITVGIGVDDTIHYVHRFRVEFEKDRDYTATMYRCHGSIGKAMYYTSLIIIVGFSVLVLSNFTPSIYFGVLTGAAMFAALMGALLLLPQLLITFKPLGPPAQQD